MNSKFINFDHNDIEFVLSKIDPDIKKKYKKAAGQISDSYVSGLLNIFGIKDVKDVDNKDPMTGKSFIEKLENAMNESADELQSVSEASSKQSLEYANLLEEFKKAKTPEEKEEIQNKLYVLEGR